MSSTKAWCYAVLAAWAVGTAAALVVDSTCPSPPPAASTTAGHPPEPSSSPSRSRREFLQSSTLAATAAPLALSPLAPSTAAVAAAATAIPTTTLGSLTVSQSIQGYWQLAGGHGEYTESEALTNMRKHLDAGFTTFDTADIYGPSEAIIGKLVAEGHPEAVICTKFCCFRGLDKIDRAQVRQRIVKALARLNLKSLPLVAFFWADYSVPRYVDVALMLTELKAEGLIQEIGVTNFDTKRLKELVDAGVPVVSNQVQYSLLDQRPERAGLRQYCVDHGIKLIAFGTVGAGLLSSAYLNAPPPSQAQLAEGGSSLRMYAGTAQRAGTWDYVQELLSVLDTVSKKYTKQGITIANVAQRYILEQEGVGCLLLGVRNSKHIADNVRTHSFALDAEDKAAIRAVLDKAKGPKGDVWDLERGYV